MPSARYWAWWIVGYGDSCTPLARPQPPTSVTRGLDVHHWTFNGWAVYTLQTKSPSERTVVRIHGGAFTLEPTILHWRDYVSIARDTGAKVVVPIYPLAPKGTAATVVPQMADLISSLITRHGAQWVSVYGDSAGGTLALAAAQELVRRDAETPDRLVLISPCLDVTFRNPAYETIGDPVLRRAEPGEAGALWAGDLDPTNPLVTPLFGLPPTATYAGSVELLAPDTLRLRERAIAEGADISFDLRRGLTHDWALPSSVEGRQVRSQIYRQLRGSSA